MVQELSGWVLALCSHSCSSPATAARVHTTAPCMPYGPVGQVAVILEGEQVSVYAHTAGTGARRHGD